MSIDRRTLPSVYHIEVKLDGIENVTITFCGTTKGKRDLNLESSIPFSYISHLIRNLKKAWDESRRRRMCIIAEVDAVLPQEVA